MPKDPSNPNSYSIIISELGNPYSEIAQAVKLLHEAGGFDIVLPEVLIERLVTETNAKQQCPMPTGSWAKDVGDLPKCAFAGNGSCVMTCYNVAKLGPVKVPIPVACNLDVCSDLSLSPSRLHFRCPDGKKCPGE